MQVTHTNDHITHAVISAGKTIDFGITNSAEFFHILSSTLYQDQVLAVVRETLCNAWDAHLDADRTDRPVEVTLTNKELVIRDFGHGIPHDMIGPIYGTYGNSTKKNDGNQTGGFGLGCKSPFAYTDHFEVVSIHNGLRTVYQMSKSSAQADGKPAINTIVQVPAVGPDAEPGIRVSLTLKSDFREKARFDTLIRRIARNGEMRVLLNGVPITPLGFDPSVNPWFFHKHHDLLAQDTTLAVRYGNVVYPIENNREIDAPYQKVVRFIAKLNNKRCSTNYSLLLQAPPNSLSVQPSREGLSMQPRTVTTLITLLEDFLTTLSAMMDANLDKVIGEITQETVKTRNIPALLDRRVCLPIPLQSRDDTAEIRTIDQLAVEYLRCNYPNTPTFRKADITRRLRLMIHAGLVDKTLAQALLQEVNTASSTWDPEAHYNNEASTTWLRRMVLAPLETALQNTHHLDPKHLYVCDPKDNGVLEYELGQRRPPMVQSILSQPEHPFACLPYLRRIVVLTQNQCLITKRMLEAIQNATGDRAWGFLLYHVGRKKSELAAAREFFAAQPGVTVIDIIEETKSAAKVKKTLVAAPPRKPRSQGLVRLDQVIAPNVKHRIDARLLKTSPGLERTTTPEFVTTTSIGRNDDAFQRIAGFHPKTSWRIAKLFGARGAVTLSRSQCETWIDKGIKPLHKFLVGEVTAYLLNNSRVAAYCAFDPLRVCDRHMTNWEMQGKHACLRTVYNLPFFQKKFNLPNNLTPLDYSYLAIWEEFKNTSTYASEPEVIQLKAWMNEIPLDPHNLEMVRRMKSPLLDNLSLHLICKILERDPGLTTSKARQTAGMLNIALHPA